MGYKYHKLLVTVATQDNDPYIQGIQDVMDYVVSQVENYDEYPILVDSIIEEH